MNSDHIPEQSDSTFKLSFFILTNRYNLFRNIFIERNLVDSVIKFNNFFYNIFIFTGMQKLHKLPAFCLIQKVCVNDRKRSVSSLPKKNL